MKDTIKKALEHTLNLDKDKNGIITLEEGLEDYSNENSSVNNEIIQATNTEHNAWVEHEKSEGRNPLDSNTVLVRDIPIYDI